MSGSSCPNCPAASWRAFQGNDSLWSLPSQEVGFAQRSESLPWGRGGCQAGHLEQVCSSGPLERLDYPLRKGCTPSRLSVVSLGKGNDPPQDSQSSDLPVPVGSHLLSSAVLSRPGACHWAGCFGKAPPSACGWGVSQGLEPLPKSPSSTTDTVGPSVHQRRGQAWTNAIGCRALVVPHQAPNPGAHFTRSARPRGYGADPGGAEHTSTHQHTPSHPSGPALACPLAPEPLEGRLCGPLPDEPNPQHV